MKNTRFINGKIKGDVAERHALELFLHLDLEFIPFGYEKTHPRLAELQRNNGSNHKETISVYKRIRSMPDFAVVDHATGKMFLLEIKYRKKYSESEMIKIADRIPECWDVGYILLITNDGIYIRNIEALSGRGSKPGYMDLLPIKEKKGVRLWSPQETQELVINKVVESI